MRRWLSTKGQLGWQLLRRNRNAVGAVGAVFLLAWLALYVLPPTLVPAGAADWAKAESDARTALVQAMVGVVLLVGLLFTAGTLRLNRQGQITERFTKAIEQLGDSKLDVRLGGIYALERIARDSRDDHRTIMEVLTAFLREHSWEATPGQVSATEKGTEWRLRADMQAVATVLGRRRREHEHELERPPLDLADVHLEGAFFWGAHLEGAYFGYAHLEEASFGDAHLEGAFFWGAHLEGASFEDAHLEGAYFEDAHASHSTTWPKGFDPAARGVTID